MRALRTLHPEPTHTFAGFSSPHAIMPRCGRTLAERRRSYSGVTGPYYKNLDPAGRPAGWGFYLDEGAGAAWSLRWQWADKVEGACIRHTGWYMDEFQDETLRGIVLRLPHGRGFLAGWSMGESMASDVGPEVYDDEVEAAYAADGEAEAAAEREREYCEEEETK